MFLVEDDTVIPPPYALKHLMRTYSLHPFAGFVTGVELGRWGIPHVGLWKADDVYEPSEITSLTPGQGVSEIDAAGLYCCLVKTEHYLKHDFKPFDNNALGPDVDFGIAFPQQGYMNYVDWSVSREHRTGDRVITIANSEVRQVSLSRMSDGWRTSVIS